MKVAILVHRFAPAVGGAENLALRLAEGLVARGDEVTVFTTRDPRREASAFPFPVRELTARTPFTRGYFFWPGSLRAKLLRDLASFDVIHAVDVSMWSALLARVAWKRHGVPYVVTSLYHPADTQRFVRVKRAYDKTLLRRILRDAAAVLVLSASEERAIAQGTGFAGPFLRFPCGAEESLSQPARREGPFRALYVGRLDSHKGVQDILGAVPLLEAKASRPWSIDVVGERAPWFELPPAFEAKHERVRFRGRLAPEALARAYAEADLLILPSRYETFGLVLVEALAHGAPVLSTPVGIAPEIVSVGKTGWLYAPGDLEGFARGFLAAMEADLARRGDLRGAVAPYRWSAGVAQARAAHEAAVKAARR